MAENKKGKDDFQEEEFENNHQDSEENQADLDSEEIEISEEERLQMELKEAREKYLRMYAEFENFRRRTSKEKIDLINTASQGLIKDLLPVLDDFERAQSSFENAKDIEPIKEGVALVYSKLSKVLADKGLNKMETKGEVFDAEIHECITQINGGDEQKGKIIDEIEKGYTLKEKVIRFAKVVVGS